MEKIIIEGGRALKGAIAVGGAKNAATPILAATLLTKRSCVIGNVPRVEDILRMLELLSSLGAKIEWLGPHKIKIEAEKIDTKFLKDEIICQLRSSILLWGALIGRVGKFAVGQPGGCVIGSRTIEPHLDALESLGVSIKKVGKKFHFNAEKLRGADLTLGEVSVTATENALLAAVLAPGTTIVRCAVGEPHVQDLCYFLNKMGAKISGIGSSILKIIGVKSLRGVSHDLIPDPIEMGTFISLIAASGGQGVVKNAVSEFIPMELKKFQEAGLKFKIKNSSKVSWGYLKGDLEIFAVKKLKAVARLHNMPFPGFAADNLPPFAVLMTQAEGQSLIHDWMYDGRMNYFKELKKMGARVNILNHHEAIIDGPSRLKGTKIKSYDLRAGASLIIAALIARGRSEISDVYQIDRGYEKIEERLQKLGANIIRVKNAK